MESADVGRRFPEDFQKLRLYGGKRLVDFLLRNFQRGNICLVELFGIGNQCLVAVFPHIGDDIGYDIRNIQFAFISRKNLVGTDGAVLHNFDHQSVTTCCASSSLICSIRAVLKL